MPKASSLEISPSVERFGYSREQLIGTQVMDVYENPEQRSALVKAVIEQGDVTDHEIRLTTGDGRVIDISVSAHLLRDDDGTFIGTEGTLRDISDRKAAEEALREQARRDPLTGVLNHGAIVDEMRRLISLGEQAATMGRGHDRCQRPEGHERHLRPSGGRRRASGRRGRPVAKDGALVGRYGGDEFVAILPGADRQAAERYRSEGMDALARATVTDPQTGDEVSRSKPASDSPSSPKTLEPSPASSMPRTVRCTLLSASDRPVGLPDARRSGESPPATAETR